MAKKVLISKHSGVQFGYCPRMADTGEYEIHIIDDVPVRQPAKGKTRKPKAAALPKAKPASEPAPTPDDLDLDALLNGLDT